MAYPDDPLPDPSTWFSNVLVTAVAIKANIIDALNALRNIGRGFIGENTNNTAVTLSGTSAFLGGAVVAVTVPTGGRRYRALVKSTFILASGASGRYLVQAAYNPGASLDRNGTTFVAGGTVVPFGQAIPVINGVTGGSGANGAVAWGTVFLPAGSYVFGVQVTRSSGGTTTDTAANFSVELEDIGAA